MHFSYDIQGRPLKIEYAGRIYDFVSDFQGDIVGILDETGTLIVEYKYNTNGIPAFTHIFSSKYTKLAELNPFRYRGYVYDDEIQLYYLRNRVYSSEYCRFISPDTVVASDRSLRDSNIFIYCNCEPIGKIDIDGNWWLESCINWVSDNIIEPVVEGVEEVANSIKEAVSNIDLTVSLGVNASVSLGIWAFNVQWCISFDLKGNIAYQRTLSGGAISSGELGASATGSVMITNAPTVYHLEGMGYQLGASISNIPLLGLPIGTVGTDVNIIPNSNGGYYYGYTISAGVSTPSTNLIDVHAEWGKTKTIADLPRVIPAPQIISAEERARVEALIEGIFSPENVLRRLRMGM